MSTGQDGPATARAGTGSSLAAVLRGVGAGGRRRIREGCGKDRRSEPHRNGEPQTSQTDALPWQ